jgi:hypothetical protein
MMSAKTLATAASVVLLLLVATFSSTLTGSVDIKNSNKTALRRQLTKLATLMDPQTTQTKVSFPEVPATVVTAYFQVPSKTAHILYLAFINNFLQMEDHMVIFTTPDLVEYLTERRAHALERTTIIPMSLDQNPFATQYSTEFWEKQLDEDPGKAIHQSYQLLWIWLSKTWFVMEAIRINPYGHRIYAWTDIGSFRTKEFVGKVYARHTHLVPQHSMLLATCKNNPEELAQKAIRKSNGWITDASSFYQVGGFQVGYVDTFQKFHAAFMETVEAFVKKGFNLGDDQKILQTTCNLNYDLCKYITPNQTPEAAGNWFFMQQVLSNGGNFQLWTPPRVTQPALTAQ